MNRTVETIRQTIALETALMKATQPVTVESQTDDGEWLARTFADEKTAVHYEAQLKRRGVATRRPA